jgi:hypothetical protein
MAIPAYADWVKKTTLGVFAARGAELRAVDQALLEYSKATSTYAKEWTSNELRIALEKWKKTTGAAWKTNERNKSKIFETLDEGLPPSKANRIGSGSAMEGQTAVQLRHATLFFLAKCSTSAIPSHVAGFLDDGTDTSASVQTFVGTGDAGGWRFVNGSFYDKANKKNSFLDDLIDKLIAYVKELASFVGDAA